MKRIVDPEDFPASRKSAYLTGCGSGAPTSSDREPTKNVPPLSLPVFPTATPPRWRNA